MSVHKPKGSQYFHYDFTFKGNRYRGSTKARKKSAARIVEGRERAKAEAAHIEGHKEQHTLAEAFAKYIDEHAMRLPSLGNIVYQTEKILAGLGKHTLLVSVKDAALSEYIAKRRGQVGDSSVNREITLLRAVLRMAQRKWKWETAQPDWQAHWLTEPDPRDRYLTDDEFARLMDELADHLKPMVLFSVLTGVRLANCINLDWSQVDMQARQISLKVKSKKDGGKSHSLPMTNGVFMLLVRQGPCDEGPVFTYTPRGKNKRPRPIRSPRKGFRRACERAKIRNFRWHDLRHTAATWMVQAGVPLDAVQDTLGHQSIETTRRYAHRQDEAKLRAMEAVDSRIAGPKSPAVGQHGEKS